MCTDSFEQCVTATGLTAGVSLGLSLTCAGAGCFTQERGARARYRHPGRPQPSSRFLGQRSFCCNGKMGACSRLLPACARSRSLKVALCCARAPKLLCAGSAAACELLSYRNAVTHDYPSGATASSRCKTTKESDAPDFALELTTLSLLALVCAWYDLVSHMALSRDLFAKGLEGEVGNNIIYYVMLVS